MLRFLLYLFLAGALGALAVVTAVLWLYLPQLPDVSTLREVKLQTPLRVYTADDKLVAEFGEQRREPVAIEAVPQQVINAFLAAEDDKFYSHPGVDFMALTRAVVELARTGEKRQGGSTITMQVARNFFLSRDRTYERKIKEILLSLKIEREISKAEILELYLNKIFLGQRSYGIAAAAQVYYGVPLSELTLAQAAVLAGLPKAPSDLNPVTSPDRARSRRHYVLGRMRALGMIDEAAYAEADAAPITAELKATPVELDAPYVAEMARTFLIDLVGDSAYIDGYRVYTTIESRLQRAADDAIVNGLVDFTERHGYRGVEGSLELPAGLTEAVQAAQAALGADNGTVAGPEAAKDKAASATVAMPPPLTAEALAPWLDEPTRTALHALLRPHRSRGGLAAGVVLALASDRAIVWTRDDRVIDLPVEGMRWARRFINADRRGDRPETPADLLAVGNLVRYRFVPPKEDDKGNLIAGYHRLAALPEAESALISLDPNDGRILALKGGFDYQKSKFNRALQAYRQPGSNFKPFIYSSAIDAGFTPASFVNDAPIVFDAPGLETVWRPENYSGKYYGPTRLRVALAKSRNLVSIRLLREVGLDHALSHVGRFGFDVARLPRNLSLSLGSGEVAPVELARGYSVFANGGHLVNPYIVARVEDASGKVLWRAAPPTVCDACDPALLDADGQPKDVPAFYALPDEPPVIAPRVLDAANAWTMASMLSETIRMGTGVRARSLGRSDLAGKTGTTNDQKDAWFTGFNADIVTTVWVGYDSNEPLGRRETGASAALPLWIDYMAVALDGLPEHQPERPPGLVAVRIDPATGLRAPPGFPDAIFEYFKPESVPRESARPAPRATDGGTTRTPAELF